ncbi:cytoskeleton protein RodZ [Enterovibrio paralichthyis]|uniref:cytoskeleton protein RodZ n=1 Tax=Enterovibrio paralichthyis TaxID=2853805 RepID=UPI001C45BD3C|nr:cytoskeleton protein RodZ [Enterovibrio paralichthyis]MBV7299074.1 cytoskeleton protein RodZ [Enterovibrio paralichthyis]
MNTEQNEEQQLEVESTHPGKILKKAREAMGLSEQDVADRLRLRASVIRELEDNCCDDQQIATFTRGYIRSYAKLVGLNADELLGNFKPTPQAEENAQKMQSFSRKTRLEKNDSRVMSLTWVILAAAVGLTAFWWWQNQQNDSLLTLGNDTEVVVDETAMLSPVDEAVAEPMEEMTVAEVMEPEAPDNADTALVVENEVIEPAVSEVVETSPAITAPVEVAKTEEPANKPAADTPNMVLSFDGDCWVDIRDASGKRLLTGIKSAGETIDLTGQAPFKLVLGAPAAVNIEYNGEKVDLSGYPSGRVARLSLPK